MNVCSNGKDNQTILCVRASVLRSYDHTGSVFIRWRMCTTKRLHAIMLAKQNFWSFDHLFTDLRRTLPSPSTTCQPIFLISRTNNIRKTGSYTTKSRHELVILIIIILICDTTSTFPLFKKRKMSHSITKLIWFSTFS